VGAPVDTNENGLGAAGLVQVFHWTGSSTSTTWSQMGNNLWGTEKDGHFGYSLAFSADGTQLVIGEPLVEDCDSMDVEDDSGECVNDQIGHVHIFKKWSENTWSTVGNNLKGTAAGFDMFGSSLAFSSDGTLLVHQPLEENLDCDYLPVDFSVFQFEDG